MTRGCLNVDTECNSIIYHANLNVLLITTDSAQVYVFDVNSGVILQRSSLLGKPNAEYCAITRVKVAHISPGHVLHLLVVVVGILRHEMARSDGVVSSLEPEVRKLQEIYLSDGIDKVLYTDGRGIGIRSDYNGVLLLDTILQTPVSKSEDVVKRTIANLVRACVRNTYF